MCVARLSLNSSTNVISSFFMLWTDPMCQHFPFLIEPWLVAPTTFATHSASNFAASLSCHDKRFLLLLLHVTPPADPHLPNFLFRSGRAQHLLNNKFRMSGVRLQLEKRASNQSRASGVPAEKKSHSRTRVLMSLLA